MVTDRPREADNRFGGRGKVGLAYGKEPEWHLAPLGLPVPPLTPGGLAQSWHGHPSHQTFLQGDNRVQGLEAGPFSSEAASRATHLDRSLQVST